MNTHTSPVNDMIANGLGMLVCLAHLKHIMQISPFTTSTYFTPEIGKLCPPGPNAAHCLFLQSFIGTQLRPFIYISCGSFLLIMAEWGCFSRAGPQSQKYFLSALLQIKFAGLCCTGFFGQVELDQRINESV